MALFVVSGACGLVYEIAWTRLFTLVIGNTVFSVSAILAVFMAGLALGSRLAGPFIDRRPVRLARAYAVLEAGLGGYNLVLPWLLKAADPVFGALYSSFYQSTVLLSAGRLGIVFILLIVPATLMGATLPILVRFYVDDVQETGTLVGRVYAANTLGAAIGAAAAGFILVPQLGVTASVYLAAFLNLGIAIVASTTSSSLRGGVAAPPTDVEKAGTGWRAAGLQTPPHPPQRGREVRIAMFLSGLAALADEVAWTRVLALVVGPTTYAFTLMLCAMITGLGIGAAAGSRLAGRRKTSPSTLAWIELGVGLTSLALVPAFGRLPLWMGQVTSRYAAAFQMLQAVEFAVFFGLMLVPTMLLGMTFPIASALYAKSESLLGTDISAIYAFNTIGGIAGSLIAGFVLIPRLGSQTTLILAAGLSTAIAILLTRRWKVVTLTLVTGAGALLIPRWDPELMSSGAYKYAPLYSSRTDLESMLTSGDILYFKEGEAATVSVRKHRGNVALSIDGKVDATDAGDMTTQKMLAHLPLLLTQEPKNVAIIGLGSGVTAAAALKHPIEKLDVIEISPEVVEASRLFAHVNRGALGDPRTELIMGDGRNHLRYTNRRYDVIISEPSNPWMAGMASLFTREFFREARSHLTERGIHCQWFHGYNMSVGDLRTIIATFRSEFPHAMLWTLTGYDFFLLGSRSPATIETGVFSARFAQVAADLAEIKIQDPESILSSLILREDGLDRFAAGAGLHTDNLPVLEFRAPRSIYADTTEQNLAALTAAVSPRSEFVEPNTAAHHVNKGEMLLAAEAFDKALKEFQAAIALDIDSERAWKGLAGCARGVDRTELQSFIEMTLRAHSSDRVRLAAADFYAQQGNDARVIEVLEPVGGAAALEKMTDALANSGSARLEEVTNRLLAVLPESTTGLYHLGTIRFYQSRIDEAIQFAKRSLNADPKNGRARNLLAAAYDRAFQPQQAEAEFRRAIEYAPDDWVSSNNYGVFLLGRDRIPEALEQFRRAISLNPENVQGFVGMGEAFRQSGNSGEAGRWYRKALRLDPNNVVAKQFVQ